MALVPFKVSARTARLIGSQNFSNAEGAITELVKNCYDADAKNCIVFFDNRFSTIPDSLSANEFAAFKAFSLISEHYKPQKGGTTYRLDLGLNEPLSLKESEKAKSLKKIDDAKIGLRAFFQSKVTLYIIDDGEGMTDKIIRDFWMVIGTDNKEEEIFTREGRIKTGAKGIGRFALDRLGRTAEMTTKPNLKKYPQADSRMGFSWSVDWNEFDGGKKIIGDVKAELLEIKPVDFSDKVKDIISEFEVKHKLRSANFKHGTIIRITGLKDTWDAYYVSKIFSSLEVLIPPREDRRFDIFVLSTASPSEYGRVDPSFCDDFDYKLTASVNTSGQANITVFRHEHEFAKLGKQFFARPKMKEEYFRKEVFRKGRFSYKRSLTELLPGYKDVDENRILQNIGAFDFVLYFMKFQTAAKDKERFAYKDFDPARRQAWLKEFGGIKLFRDNFRVRPYGEPKGPAFDWLDLGSRAAASPAGIGKKGGGYKVRPNNVSGIISISRITNIAFEDKSSREGLQENAIFSVFKQIIIKLVEEFENDRASVAREISEYYDATHREQVTEEKAEEIIDKIRQSAKSKTPDDKKTEDQRDKEILAEFITQKVEEIDELRNEGQLLKVLASNAITIASFTHELSGIEKNLVNRVDEAEKQFKGVVDLNHCKSLPGHLNPFVMLADIKSDDLKLKEWLGYSLSTLRKDKRRRRDIPLVKYFDDFERSWKAAFESRGINFKSKLPSVDPLKIHVFESDLDCIFNNLITNSFEAFKRKDAPAERNINIALQIVNSDFIFTYRDSGPGLSKDIADPSRIFEPHFTTKKDVHTGEDIGTGLGMWLVKSFVQENEGSVELILNKPGFGLKIHLPNKLKSKGV